MTKKECYTNNSLYIIDIQALQFTFADVRNLRKRKYDACMSAECLSVLPLHLPYFVPFFRKTIPPCILHKTVFSRIQKACLYARYTFGATAFLHTMV